MNKSFCWETKIFKVRLNSMIQYIQGRKKIKKITNLGYYVIASYSKTILQSEKLLLPHLFASNNLIFNNKTTNE
jgi:hypothetical protein